jgi:hypothetical protein
MPPKKKPASTKPKKVKTKPKRPANLNPWLLHVGKVRTDNPDLSYKACLQKAKGSYKKSS